MCVASGAEAGVACLPLNGELQTLYSSDNFRMYCFKVLPCSKRTAHNWQACPFAHFGERARRRDPRLHMYSSSMCPDAKREGGCPRKDSCPLSHNIFEAWLHPELYRTQLCTAGAKCTRNVCWFAHSLQELRQPSAAPQPPAAGAPGPAYVSVPAPTGSPSGHSTGTAWPGATSDAACMLSPIELLAPAQLQQNAACGAMAGGFAICGTPGSASACGSNSSSSTQLLQLPVASACLAGDAGGLELWTGACASQAMAPLASVPVPAQLLPLAAASSAMLCQQAWALPDGAEPVLLPLCSAALPSQPLHQPLLLPAQHVVPLEGGLTGPAAAQLQLQLQQQALLQQLQCVSLAPAGLPGPQVQLVPAMSAAMVHLPSPGC